MPAGQPSLVFFSSRPGENWASIHSIVDPLSTGKWRLQWEPMPYSLVYRLTRKVNGGRLWSVIGKGGQLAGPHPIFKYTTIGNIMTMEASNGKWIDSLFGPEKSSENKPGSDNRGFVIHILNNGVGSIVTW